MRIPTGRIEAIYVCASTGRSRLHPRGSSVTSASAKPSYPLQPTVWMAVALTRQWCSVYAPAFHRPIGDFRSRGNDRPALGA